MSRALSNAETVDRTAVMERLDRVSDPELDRSIVELEYVDEVRIDLPEVFVRFKLPTAWCSPAFAWMMATGIRDETERLPAVERTTVELIDHMHGAEITEGVNRRVAFEEVFEDASEGIEAVKATLENKARLARQHRAVEALLDAGLAPEQIVALTPVDVGIKAIGPDGVDGIDGIDRIDGNGDADAVEAAVETEAATDPDVDGDGDAEITVELDGGALFVRVPREPLAAYVRKAIETGLLTDADERLFATPEGEPIDVAEFDLVHHRARAAKVNAAGQGSVCAQLHEARYGIGVDEPAD